jgi:predicted nucleic acid-binding protein
MDLYLDTSFIIPLIIDTDTTEKARDFYTSFAGTTTASMSVYEESFFVGLRLIARNESDIRSTAQLKNYIRSEGYGFADEFLHNLNELFSGLVIVPDTANLRLIEDMARTYSLLPNDALIVATCRENGIPGLATFDKDFLKVRLPSPVKL